LAPGLFHSSFSNPQNNFPAVIIAASALRLWLVSGDERRKTIRIFQKEK
jgi:hypothetical protein